MNRQLCYKLNSDIERVVQAFVDEYYTYEDWSYAEAYAIDHESDWLHYNWCIGDDYWNVDDMYTALWYGVKESDLFVWYDKKIEEWTKKALGKEYEVVPNLKNFYLMNKSEF